MAIMLTEPTAVQVETTAASSEATARCLAGAPVLSASSTAVAVTVNGVPVQVAGGVASQYPVPGIRALYLNYHRQVDTDATPGPDTVTQRAVFLDPNNPSVPDIVIAEAIAGIRGCS